MTAGAITYSPNKVYPVLFNPGIDLLVAGGGLSVLLILFLLLNDYTLSPAWLTGAIFWLTIAVNYPHYAATYYRVYRSTSEIRRYVFAGIIAPAALIALGVACFYSPALVAPWYCKAYVIGSGIHYSGQSYGIALIFAKKSGLKFENWQKLCIAAPIFMSAIYGTLYNEAIGAQPRNLFGVILPPLGLSDYAILPMLLMLVGAIEAYVFLNIFFWWKQRKRLPLIVHIVFASHFGWYMSWRYQPFVAMVPFFHCFQYLLITSYFNMKELLTKGSYTNVDPMPFLRSMHFLKYYAILIVLGYALFEICPKVVSWTGICTFDLASAIIISFLNLHHFVLDSEIWKLRKPEIGNVLVG